MPLFSPNFGHTWGLAARGALSVAMFVTQAEAEAQKKMREQFEKGLDKKLSMLAPGSAGSPFT